MFQFDRNRISMRTGKTKITIKIFRRRVELSAKMIGVLIGLIIAPVVIALVSYTLISASMLEQEVIRNMQLTVEQTKDNLDYRMLQVEESAMSILTTIYPYLNTNSSRIAQFDEYREINRIFAEYNDKHMISKLRLFVPPEKIYHSQGDVFHSLDDLETVGYKYFTDFTERRGTLWLETYDLVFTFGEPARQVISSVRAVSSADNYDEMIGVLYIDITVSKFNEILNSSTSEDERLFIVNSDGLVLSHPDANIIGFKTLPDGIIKQMHTNEPFTDNIEVEGEDTLLVYHRLETTDWYLVMTSPRNRVFTTGFFSLDMIRLVLILSIVLCFLLALVALYKIVVESTFIGIYDQIESLGLGTVDAAGCNKQRDDLLALEKKKPGSLATLEQNAMFMVTTIKSLLECQYRDQIAAKDYHMQALQAQINPHFLYNTLDVIKWMAADDDKEDTIWMVNALSKYFRLSISKGRDIVFVKDEIELTETYIGIMQRRFKGIFKSEFSVDPSAERCLIPKLSLQPIIENALLHGILYSEKPDQRLLVEVRIHADNLVVVIEDNGAGMNKKTLELIRSGKKFSDSYGLSNVIERLNLFSENVNTDPFQIISTEGIGTKVTITLPIVYQNSEENK